MFNKNKIKRIIKIGGLSLLPISTCLTVSIPTLYNHQKNYTESFVKTENISSDNSTAEKIIASYDSVFQKESIDAINQILTQKNVTKNSEQLNINKEFWESNLKFNQDNFLLQNLRELNIEEKYKEILINEINNLYNNEFPSINENSRHGGIFTKHFWRAVSKQIETNSIFVLSFLNLAANLTVPILQMIEGDFIGASESWASIDLTSTPDWIRSLTTSVIKNVRNFLKNEYCSWAFKIWSVYGESIKITWDSVNRG